MNPGPVNVTGRVRRALLRPDICHREEEFSTLLAGIRKKILNIFGISKTHTVALFTASGTAALESMLLSFADKDKKILVLSNGVYGERLRTILECRDLPCAFLSCEIGQFPDLKKIESLLKNDASIHGIAMVHHETSSGMLNPLEAVATLAEKHGKTLLVDAVSSLGAEKIDFKKRPIGFLAGVSGKCLHGFPGISFVILSQKEAVKLQNRQPKSLYLDLKHALAWEDRNDMPFTPAVQIFYALNEALDELTKETLSERIKNYAEKSRLVQQGLEDLGASCLIRDKNSRSHVLSAFWMPKNLSYDRLHAELKKAGFVIYAGQSKFKDKIFRVANLGDVQEKDLNRFLKILGRVIRAGHDV